MHTDGLNECLSVEDTLDVLAGRTIHAFHIEGCGGGHSPDVLRLLGEPNIIASSTNPTIPFGVQRGGRARPMVRRGARAAEPEFPDDVAIGADRVRAATMGAEDVLHDLGLIAITSSDSQGMGRVGETVRRTFQLASKMRDERGADGPDDNERVLRYLAKCTINPALAHGLAHEVGRAHAGPAGRRRAVAARVVRRQARRWCSRAASRRGAPTGDPNAVVDYCEPQVLGPQFGAHGGAAGRAVRRCSSPAPRSTAAARSGCRRASAARPSPAPGAIGAADMVRNDRLGAVRVDPVTHEVTLDGEPMRSEPAATVPLSALYLLG